MTPRLFLFPDTNILLEYKRLDDPDWQSAFTNQHVSLVICTKVLGELDNAKQAKRLRTQKRARRLISWLWRHLREDAELPNGLTLDLFRSTPVRVFETGELDRNIPDDFILASAIYYQNQYPQRAVGFLSEDTGALIRAEAFGIRPVSPPTELRLPPELSDEEQELKHLRKEVERLKLGAPQLWLGAGPEPQRACVNALDESEDEWVERQLASARKKWKDPELHGREVAKRVYDYLADLENHERKLFPIWCRILRTFYLQLELGNNGGAPATDIDLFLEAPQGLVFETGLPEMPDRPKEPKIPNPFGFIEPAALSNNPLSYQLPNIPSLADRLDNVGEWILDERTVARINISSVKHGLKVNLPPLLARFDGGISNFGLGWTAYLSNTRNPFEGRLNFIADQNRDGDGLVELIRGSSHR